MKEGRAAVFLLLVLLLRSVGAAAGTGADAESGRGIGAGLTYLGEVFSNLAGGLRRGPVYIHNVSLTLSLDLNKLAGWRGATLFVYGMNIEGGNPELRFGEAQTVSNIAAPHATRLYEAWLQQELAQYVTHLHPVRHGQEHEVGITHRHGRIDRVEHSCRTLAVRGSPAHEASCAHRDHPSGRRWV